MTRTHRLRQTLYCWPQPRRDLFWWLWYKLFSIAMNCMCSHLRRFPCSSVCLFTKAMFLFTSQFYRWGGGLKTPWNPPWSASTIYLTDIAPSWDTSKEETTVVNQVPTKCPCVMVAQSQLSHLQSLQMDGKWEGATKIDGTKHTIDPASPRKWWWKTSHERFYNHDLSMVLSWKLSLKVSVEKCFHFQKKIYHIIWYSF